MFSVFWDFFIWSSSLLSLQTFVLVLSSLHLVFSWCSPAWCDGARLLGSWPNLSRESPLRCVQRQPASRRLPGTLVQNSKLLLSKAKPTFQQLPLQSRHALARSGYRHAEGRARKNSKKSDLLLFFRCALHFWELVKTSNSSSACHFSTTLEIC